MPSFISMTHSKYFFSHLGFQLISAEAMRTIFRNSFSDKPICVCIPLLEPLKDAGCTTNDECSSSETCQNRVCINPCTNGNPCDRSAECRVENHRAVCSCPPNHVGDPFVKCYLEPVANRPECSSNTECAATLACINQLCVNPCADRNLCTENAECHVVQHHPRCTCPAGWAGDPQTRCYKRKLHAILELIS